MRRKLLCMLAVFLLLTFPFSVSAEAPAESELYAQAAVLMDADSGRVLYSKNGDAKLPMASTTKIMTCIVALEMGNLDDVYEATSYAASMPKVHLGVQAGEQYRLKDLLYALMLESFNDSAVVIAEGLAGSVDAFAELMNQKAWDLGCMDTYFITPNGLDAADDNGIHSTTAQDLATIMSYCIQNEEFLEITRTQSYSFTDVSGKRSFTCNNHNSFLSMMEGALSGKTGFTNNAGYCYVGSLRRDGKTYVVALLACGWPNNKSYKWSDTKKLMNYGLSDYNYRDVWQEPNLSPILVDGGIPESGDLSKKALVRVQVKAGEQTSLSLLLRADEEVKMEIQQASGLTAPVAQGETIGKVVYTLNGNTVAEYPIVTEAPVEKISLNWCLKKVWDHVILHAEDSSGLPF